MPQADRHDDHEQQQQSIPARVRSTMISRSMELSAPRMLNMNRPLGEGFEPPTFGLQNRCTTTVLTRQGIVLTAFPAHRTAAEFNVSV